MPLFSLSASQYLLAIVSASILHKLTVNRLFLRWLTSHKTSYYQVPSNYELKHLRDKPEDVNKQHKDKKVPRHRRANKNQATNSNHGEEKDVIFKVPNLDLSLLNLKRANLTVKEVENIRYAVDLEWIVDLALMSLFCYILTEVQFFFYPQTTECNFSLIWCLLVIVYCCKSLWTLTAIYFKSEESIGERSICIVSGCLFLLVAMLVLTLSEDYLELGFDSGYRTFNTSAFKFVNTQRNMSGLENSKLVTKPVSLVLVKFSASAMCALAGMLFTFPGLRYGQLHQVLLSMPETSARMKTVYNLNFISYLFIVCLWIKPLTRDALQHQNYLPIDDTVYDTFRIYCVVLVNLFKVALLPNYVTIFITSTVEARLDRMRFRGGNTTNREIQTTLSSIINYFNVVVIQYLLPILMCFFTCLVFKSLGAQSWVPSLSQSDQLLANDSTTTSHNETVATTTPSSVLASNLTGNQTSSNSTLLFSSFAKINLSDLKDVFSAPVFRGIFGFATWWLHFSWFCTSTAGVAYHRYFTH